VNNIDEVIAALPEASREAAKKVVMSSIEVERAKAIESTKEYKNEAESLRKRFKGPLKELFGVVDGGDLPENWQDEIKKWKGATASMSDKDKALMSQLEELKATGGRMAEMEKALAAITKEKEDLKREKINATIMDGLRKGIGGKIYNEETTMRGLVLSGEVGYDSEKNKLYWNVDGKAADFDEGLKQFLSKADVKVASRPGSGSSGAGGSAADNDEAARAVLRRIGVLK